MQYDVIVIGRGLIGSAVARHLAVQGAHVALIGPGEPIDHRTHTGVFGSHYDSGRITRILDPIPYFAHIAKQSIRRYRPLEIQTGIQFYHEVGYLVVSNNTGYLADMEARAQEFYPQVEQISGAELAERFPYFHFPQGVRALYQATDGGHINPRQHIAAQNKALEMHGGTVIAETVLELDTEGEPIRAKIGSGWVYGHKVVLATGALCQRRWYHPSQDRFSGGGAQRGVWAKSSRSSCPPWPACPRSAIAWGLIPCGLSTFCPRSDTPMVNITSKSVTPKVIPCPTTAPR